MEHHRSQSDIPTANSELPLPGARLTRHSSQNADEYQTVQFRPLINFIKHNTRYLTADALITAECPICQDAHSESRELFMQIDLPTCRHVFGATCLERHILGSNTCPLCRTVWFQKQTEETGEISVDALFEFQITVEGQAMIDSINALTENDRGALVRAWIFDRLSGNAADNASSEAESEATYVDAGDDGTDYTTGFSFVQDLESEGDNSRRLSSDSESQEPPRQRRRME